MCAEQLSWARVIENKLYITQVKRIQGKLLMTFQKRFVCACGEHYQFVGFSSQRVAGLSCLTSNHWGEIFLK